MPLPVIDPPLINSANPWATSEQDLQLLYDCPYIGAITTRTSLIGGFEHDDAVHQYTFFEAGKHAVQEQRSSEAVGSLNTLGYSPLPLSRYLSIVAKISSSKTQKRKPCILSVTGSAESVCECLRHISDIQSEVNTPLCMEINLSCPNIPDKPPPAYSKSSLVEYMHALAAVKSMKSSDVAIGIKTPPYTYHDQFKTLIDALLEVSPCPIDFITATNTLGSSLVLTDDGSPALSSAAGTGIGGMAGAPLHALALGNVKIIRSMLDQHVALKDIEIIGIGGVSDKAGFDRMRTVGAKVVGVGTALGSHGISIFERILS